MTLGNPFMRLDRAAVLTLLDSAGSRDPDVLRRRTRPLTRRIRLQTLLGIGLLLLGVLAGLTRPGPAAGVPLALAGWWLWRLGHRNAATVEAGFLEFMRSPAPSRS